ncbi:MAG: hypothetical protein Q8N89_04035 [Azonexus sp.]|nr:hypothetical protein [Azonexus sp.]
MKTRVTLLSVEVKDFAQKNKTTGAATGHVSRTFLCQCIVHGEKIEVGVARVPERVLPGYVAKTETTPVVHPDAPTPGDYMFEYGLQISYDTKELGGVLKSITPISGISAGKTVADVVAGKEKATA